jgi:hypothetical protein
MHWMAVDKTATQRKTICGKDYDSDVVVIEDDDGSYASDADLVGENRWMMMDIFCHVKVTRWKCFE